jgi:hypothetical protein
LDVLFPVSRSLPIDGCTAKVPCAANALSATLDRLKVDRAEAGVLIDKRHRTITIRKAIAPATILSCRVRVARIACRR